MTTFQDTGVTIAQETTYGTYVAGVRGVEPLGDSLGQTYNKGVVQGQGLRVGSRFPRAARRVVTNRDGTVTLTLEVTSKGMGLILNAALGASTVTVVSGATNQHNFTVGDTPPSLSIQDQVVRADGTIDAYSWLGCMCDSVEFTFNNRGLLTAAFTFDARDLSTAQSRVAPVYPTEPVNLFHFANLSINTGTFTPATTTTMPSAATGTTNIRGGSLKLDRSLIKDRFNAGLAGLKAKQLPAGPALTGAFNIEYDSIAYRDLVVSDGSLTAVVQYTAGALSTGVETIAFPVPAIKFDGELPQPNNDQLIVQNMQFTCLDDLTNTPFGVYMRTADTAL